MVRMMRMKGIYHCGESENDPDSKKIDRHVGNGNLTFSRADVLEQGELPPLEQASLPWTEPRSCVGGEEEGDGQAGRASVSTKGPRTSEVVLRIEVDPMFIAVLILFFLSSCLVFVLSFVISLFLPVFICLLLCEVLTWGSIISKTY